MIQSGHIPPEWVAIAVSHAKVLEILKKSDINWTYFSPAGFFEPGKRTGKFRLGKDALIADEEESQPHLDGRLCHRAGG